jgi:4-amino-4-deoxy-L-arabinose transferase-like glycosyltransferase
MSSDVQLPPSAWNRAAHSLLLMVVLGFGLRVAAVLIFKTYEFNVVRETRSTTLPDFKFGYETGSIAASIARGEGFGSPFSYRTGPSAWIAPLYPALVAGVFKLFGIYSPLSGVVVLSLNGLLSALTCVPIVLIGRRTVGALNGWIAGWIWALCPVYMRWPVTWVWDMSLTGLLLALVFLATLKAADDPPKRFWLMYGLLWGMAFLTNPALVSIFPLSVLWVMWKRRQSGKQYFIPVLTMFVLLVVCTSPWLVRNWVVMGKPAFFRDNFWFEFHLGNYHDSNGLGWGGKHPTLNKRELELYANLGELKYIEKYRQESLQFLRESPQEFVQLTIRRFLSFWRGDFFSYLFPYWWEKPAYVALAALSVFGVLLAFDRRVHGAFLFFTVLLCYPVVYYITYPGTRYRYAIEPEMLLLSCYFVYEVVRAVRKRSLRKKEFVPATHAGTARV